MNTQTTSNGFRNSSAHPIRFDRLHDGSYFRIVAEPSRNIRRSRDNRVYRKARDGFYSTLHDDKSVGIVLMGEDLVMPLVREDKGRPARKPQAPRL